MSVRRVGLQWFGDRVKEKSRSAEQSAVNRVMSEAVIHAKTNHAFRNRTGTLEGGIRIVNFATPHARGVRGVWGVADVRYARRIELGFQGPDQLGRVINQAARPYLRPAADATYGRLADYIAQEYAR